MGKYYYNRILKGVEHIKEVFNSQKDFNNKILILHLPKVNCGGVYKYQLNNEFYLKEDLDVIIKLLEKDWTYKWKLECKETALKYDISYRKELSKYIAIEFWFYLSLFSFCGLIEAFSRSTNYLYLIALIFPILGFIYTYYQKKQNRIIDFLNSLPPKCYHYRNNKWIE